MFYLRNLAGLGVNAAVKATANTALYQDGGATNYVAPTGPAGYTRWGIQTLRRDRWIDDLSRARGMQAFLEASYGPQILDASLIGSTRIKCNITTSSMAAVVQGLNTPIGVINVLGLLFTIVDLNTPDVTFQRTYTPNEDQRFNSDVALYLASQRSLFYEATHVNIADLPESVGMERSESILSTWDNPGASLASADIDAHLAAASRMMNLSGVTLQKLMDGTATVPGRGVVGPYFNGGKYVASLPGYSMNPIQPTPEELASADGLRMYYARGGFLLREAYATGAEAIVSKAALQWTAGYFRCGKWTSTNEVLPYENWPYGDGAGWTIQQAISADGSITMRISPSDVSWRNKVLGALATVMKELASMICASSSIIEHMNSAAASATGCTDTVTGAACKAGAKNCKCSKPSVTQETAAGVANGLVTLWCGMNQITNAGGRPPATPFTPPAAGGGEPPVTVIPWWAVVLGLGAGAYAYSRKPK